MNDRYFLSKDAMKKLMIVLMILTSCGGKLTDEQRKKLKEGMENQKIRKISEARITDAAFVMGRSIVRQLGEVSGASLEKIAAVKIRQLRDDDKTLSGIEKQITEAYAAGASSGEVGDNVQRLGQDSLLYTKPVLTERPDGSHEFNYAIGIRMSRKQVVSSIKD